MKNKLLTILLILFCMLSIIACAEENEVSIQSIEVVEETVPETILNTELEDKIDDINIKVLKSDNTALTISLSKDMISADELMKLENAGTHQVTITYQGVSTTLTIIIEEDLTGYYTAKVLYPDNTPVTSGVTVQWCTGTNCYLPQAVNSQGIAKHKLADGDYYVHIDGIPSGYTYNPNAYTTTAQNKHIEIKLLSLSQIESGLGTTESPYIVSNGVYNVSFTEGTITGMKYFSFTPTVDGIYTISSMAVDKLAMNEIDPYIGFIGTSITNNPDISGNIEGNINFTYEFEATSGTTYFFAILVSSATSFPASFDIIIK